MILGLAALAVFASFALGLTPQQERGREIFLKGQSATGQTIGAVLGASTDPISATLLPCANCHGEDGHGRPEGGVRPADITPAALGRVATIGPRTRPPYTRPLLKRAISMGYDAGRNELDRTMPRFRMSQEDANDLLAYLNVLGTDAQPGLSDDVIRVNVIGAPDLVAPATSIYGRRLELQHDRSADAFLTIDASVDGSASVEAAARNTIPTIAVYSAHAPPSRYAFVLTASNEDQIAALASYARRSRSTPVLLTADCRGIGDVSRDALVLMTSNAAANCDPADIPRALDRRVIVAAPAPPAPKGDRNVAQAALSLTTTLLAQVGRDLSRSALLAALERVYRVESPVFPPLTWTANRHFGTRAVWLMTVDVREQKLLGEPGWVEGE